MAEMAAEWVPIGALTAWAKNPRKNDLAVPRVVESIKRFGFAAPILARRADGEIIAGHTRLKAAQVLGLDKVPVRYLDLDPADAHLLALADNKLNEVAEWDDAGLAALLSEYGLPDAELAGWDSGEISKLADSLYGDTTTLDEDDVPEPPPIASTKRGDLYLLGEHRLMCGDSTNVEDVARLMNGKHAVLMNTDPPYGVNHVAVKKGIPGFSFAGEQAPIDIENDDLDGPALQAFLENAIKAYVPHLTDTPAFYFWHPMLTQGTFFAAAAAADILIHRQIIWVKPSFVLTRSGQYHWQHELCFYGWIKGKQPPWYGEKNQTSVWHIGRDQDKVGHPTQKPVSLFEPPIKNHTQRGEIICEPFSGSGSQFIAAQQLERTCYGMEFEPRYCDAIVARWEKLTGKSAERVSHV